MIFGEGEANEIDMAGISGKKVKIALRKMKKGKATGPYKIPGEVWKSMDEEGLDIFWDLLSKIHDQEKILDAWREKVQLYN